MQVSSIPGASVQVSSEPGASVQDLREELERQRDQTRRAEGALKRQKKINVVLLKIKK